MNVFYPKGNQGIPRLEFSPKDEREMYSEEGMSFLIHLNTGPSLMTAYVDRGQQIKIQPDYKELRIERQMWNRLRTGLLERKAIDNQNSVFLIFKKETD